MRFVSRNLKFGNMRKEQNFTIYPCGKDDLEVKIQSDKRIARINIYHKTAYLSKQCQNGAYSHHLCSFLGAKMFDLTDDQVNEIIAMRDSMAGNTINGNQVRLVG